MNDLWPTARLGDVVEAKYGRALPESKRESGSAPVYGSNGVVGAHSKALTTGPTIIIGRKGSVGAVNRSSEACWPIDTTFYVDDPGPYSFGFLYHLLRALGLEYLDRSTAIPGLSRDQLYDIEVPIPPLPDQAGVVSMIEDALARSAQADEHLREADRRLELLMPSILSEACSGRLTADWRASRGADDQAGTLAWQTRRLGDIAARITKGTTPTSYGHSFTSSGVAFVKVENLRHGRIVRESIRSFIGADTHRAQARSILEAGDVLFSIAGTIGRTAVVEEPDLPANTNQAVAIVRGTRALLEPEYLMIALQSAVQEAAANAARGSGMNNISLADVRNFEIPIPSGLEQGEIVRRVAVLRTASASIQGRLESAHRSLRRTTRAMFARAFDGALAAQGEETL